MAIVGAQQGGRVRCRRDFFCVYRLQEKGARCRVCLACKQSCRHRDVAGLFPLTKAIRYRARPTSCFCQHFGGLYRASIVWNNRSRLSGLGFMSSLEPTAVNLNLVHPKKKTCLKTVQFVLCCVVSETCCKNPLLQWHCRFYGDVYYPICCLSP